MRITQSFWKGYAPILLTFNRSLQKQRAKKADQRIRPRRALKAIIAILPPVSAFEIHADPQQLQRSLHVLLPHKYDFFAIGRKLFRKIYFFYPQVQRKTSTPTLPAGVDAIYLSEDYYAEKRLSISRNNL